MGDVAKGIKSFKKGMADNPDQSSSSSSTIQEKTNEDENSDTIQEKTNEDENSEKNNLKCHK